MGSTGSTRAAFTDRSSGHPAASIRLPAAAASYGVRRSSGSPSATHSQRAAPSPSYGRPTLPALTKRTPPTRRSSCWWVWPATTTGASTPASTCAQRSGDDSRVSISSSRRGLAWQYRTPFSSSVSGALASGRARSAPSSPALSAALRATRSSGARLARVQRLGDLPLAVAAQTVHRSLERLQAVERRRREGTRDGVAAHHDGVGPRGARVGEHRVERVDVAVDVVQREDPHGDRSGARPLRPG